jgi:hypothetical protein
MTSWHAFWDQDKVFGEKKGEKISLDCPFNAYFRWEESKIVLDSVTTPAISKHAFSVCPVS